MRSKSTFALTLVAAAALLAIPACKKSNNNPSAASGSTSASLKGTATQFTYTQGVEIKGIQIGVAGYNLVNGDTVYFGVSVPDSARLNVPYSITAWSNLQYWDRNHTFEYDSWLAYPMDHGNVTLTTWDKNAKTIAGTFEGVLYSSIGLGNFANDSLVITNGKFNASYISKTP
ncbi:MAG TPA: hypothetical protein VK518_22845 [Puia sp.]|nr:hypothetical protein [Puia sp.]